MYIGNDKARVAIIEDHRDVREWLGDLIAASDCFEFVGGFASVEAFIHAYSNASPLPAAVLVDLGLPGMDGIEGIRILKERWPRLTLIVLTIHADGERIFEALCAGASGYLLKTAPSGRLMEGLQDAVNGGAPISPEVASKVIQLFRRFNPPSQGDSTLTPHELRLLKLLCEGHTYKTAAETVRSSSNTVSYHIKNIYRKLQVHSKSQAVATAITKGIL